MGSPGKALAHGRAKYYPDKRTNGCNGKASESETSELKFGVWIEVRSKRIDESSFYRKILFQYIKIS